MRLVIIGCGKSKIWDKHPGVGPQKAEDVYTGSSAVVRRKYARSQGCDWMILSAKYGFIRPESVIPSIYNVTFDDPSTDPITVPELRQQVEDQDLGRYHEITIVANRKYIETAEAAFLGNRVAISTPFAGHPRGQQMHMMCQEVSNGSLAQRVPPCGETRQGAVSRHNDVIGAQTT
jgi:phage tail protein X